MLCIQVARNLQTRSKAASQTHPCRRMRFRAVSIGAASLLRSRRRGGAGGFALFPGLAEKFAEIAQTISIITAKALGAKSTRVSRKPGTANALFEERTSGALSFGNNATRSTALIPDGMALAGAYGQRLDQLAQPGCSGVPRHARKTCGFLPGIDVEPRSAERTLSPVPFRSSPIDAPRNLSNSGPMSGDSAAWAISAIPFALHSDAVADGAVPSAL